MTSMLRGEFPLMNKKRIAVIGGGASGLMAAGTALRSGADVVIFEHMNTVGRKLSITGKGRCNVTNDCTPEDFINNVVTNPRFLYSAANAFTPRDTMSFFEELGVPLKTERGNRVFPVSDKAADIVSALKKYCAGGKIINEKVTGIKISEGRACGIESRNGSYQFDAVILATGGRSYPRTGSDGSGYKLAQAAGHTVTTLSPSLVPVVSNDSVCAEMQGLSLKNVGLKVFQDGKECYRDFGEMLFTHFGMSGPIVLSSTSHINKRKLSNVLFEIDLKPALSESALNDRILRDFSERKNKIFSNSLSALLPSKMIKPFIERSGIAPDKQVNSVTREERLKLVSLFKKFAVPVSGFRPIDEAIITSGGIDVKEIDSKTMQSKLIRGLFFAGEIIDVDAYTGGFNLQIAFSTGFLAGKNAAEY